MLKRVFAGVLMLCSPCLVAGEAESVGRLMGKLRGALPGGWTVSYDASSHWLEIQRDEMVLGYLSLPSSVGMAEPDLRKYWLGFWVGEKMDEGEYARRMEVNNKLGEQMQVSHDLLVSRGVEHTKAGTFLPEGYVDGLLVQRYEAMGEWRLEVPDFYYEDLGLTASGLPGILVFGLGNEEMECRNVAENVCFQLLKPYKHSQPRLVNLMDAATVTSAGLSNLRQGRRERDKAILTRFLLRKQVECRDQKNGFEELRRVEYLDFIKKHETLLEALGKEEVHYQLSLAFRLDPFEQGNSFKEGEPNPHAEQALKVYKKYYNEYTAEEHEEIEKQIGKAEQSRYLEPNSLKKRLGEVKK